MRKFFNARNIAVIGASRDEGKVGRVIFDNLLKARKNVFPVNEKVSEIAGKKSYASVLEIPFDVELAVIVIPASAVAKVLEECGKKGVGSVIVISAGFSETGNNALSEKIKKIIDIYHIDLLGPNVLGIVNPFKDLNVSFFKEIPSRGNVAFVSQSGAVGTALLDRAIENNFGISGFVSLGNMLDQDFNNALEFFEGDIRTKVIALYIESLKEGSGQKFLELCERIGKKKKIIAIKAGKTREGKEAAETHTASISSSSRVYSGMFKQAGVIEVDSLDELFKTSEVFSKYGQIGKRACVVTNAGGLGVLAADSLIKNNLELVDIDEKVLIQLDGFLPAYYSRNNPLDIMGDALAERYEKTLRMLVSGMNKDIDFFVVIVSPQQMTQELKTVEVLSRMNKPVFICLVGGESFKEAREFLHKSEGIYFDDVEEMGRVLGKVVG